MFFAYFSIELQEYFIYWGKQSNLFVIYIRNIFLQFVNSLLASYIVFWRTIQ